MDTLCAHRNAISRRLVQQKVQLNITCNNFEDDRLFFPLIEDACLSGRPPLFPSVFNSLVYWAERLEEWWTDVNKHAQECLLVFCLFFF